MVSSLFISYCDVCETPFVRYRIRIERVEVIRSRCQYTLRVPPCLYVTEQFCNENQFAWSIIVQYYMCRFVSHGSKQRKIVLVRACSKVRRARAGAARASQAPSAQHTPACSRCGIAARARCYARAAPSQAVSVLPLTRQGAGAVKHLVQSIPERERCLARRRSEFGLLYFQFQCSNVLS